MQMIDLAAAGPLLRNARNERRLNMAEVAETIKEAGLDKAWLSKAELGMLKPTNLNLDRIEKVALLLDVTLPRKNGNGQRIQQRRPQVRRTKAIGDDLDLMADAFLTCFTALSSLSVPFRRRLISHLNAKFQ